MWIVDDVDGWQYERNISYGVFQQASKQAKRLMRAGGPSLALALSLTRNVCKLKP